MDQTADIAIGRVWTLVSGVLWALAQLPGFAAAALPGPALARAFRDLRLAEAAARRALWVIASGLPRPDLPAPSAMPEPREAVAPAAPMPPCAGPQPRPHRAPRAFDLSDPMADPLVLAGLGPAVDFTALQPHGETERARPSAGLKARMAALQAVLDDPAPAVARLVKRRDRPRRHLFDRGATARLRPGRPPGFLPHRFLDWDMDTLMEIHLLALARMHDPPLAP